MKRSILVVFASLSAMAMQACAQPPVKLTHFEAYQAILDEQVAAGIPGVSAWIRSGGKTWSGVSGVRKVETAEPMTSDTAIRLASTTKVFTQAIIYQLIQEKHLSLSDTLDDVLPITVLEGLPNTDRITIDNLLSHQSGLTNFTNTDDYNDFQWRIPENRKRILEPLELLAFARGRPANAEPGKTFEYCNTCYFLLGLNHLYGGL